MSRAALLASVLSLTLPFGPAPLFAQAPVAPGEPGKEGEKVEDLTTTPAEVGIQRELKVLEEVAKRRLALHHLKNDKGARDAILKDLDPTSSQNIQRLVDDTASFTNLEYHYLEKAKNCERRLLHRLRADAFQGIEDLLEVVKDRKFPESAAYAPLLNTVEMNFRYAIRKGLISDAEFAKDVSRRLTDETVRVNGTAGHTVAELAKAQWKDVPADQFPAHWFDPSSGPISYEFGEVPPSPPYPTIDLNTATRDALLAVPGIDPEVADAIVDYAKKNSFEGAEELRLVSDIPLHLVGPLQTLSTTSHATKRKKWTVMVFLNAANNLEPFGIEDLNEMEKVGSTRDVNVVVEMVRYRGMEKTPRVNAGYFHNPYTERETQFYYGLDNTPGNARFYVLKDEDPVRIQSVVKENAGIADGGRAKSLADFGRWAVERYPADNYALVVWNHGAGWSGVSYDDNSHHGMDMAEVREGVEQIVAKLDNGKQKLDILDFDACLMATLEVGYELKDTVDFLVASQEVEPGDGMPYDDYLAWLVKFPEAPPVSFAKAMVEEYVKSYAPKGSQAPGEFAFFGETKSALRLSRMSDLRAAAENLAELLATRRELLGEVTESIVRDVRAFGRLVDLHDFATRLMEREKADAELKAACKAITDLIGYPTSQYKLVNEVVIKRRSPGAVVWGYNDWQSPPRNLAPFVHRSRHAKTPLVGPDEKGNYVARISFPPMLRDSKAGKFVAVTQIDWRFEDEKEKRVFKDFQSMFITTDFPVDGPVVAEGHMVSNNRSRGVSIYLPAYLGFDKEYRKLRFAEDSKWAALCETFPLKKIENPQPIALLGIQHATKRDRELLGKIAVREEFREKILKHDFAKLLRGDLESLARSFDAIRDPRHYGEDWHGLIRNWRDGIVIVDNHDGIGNGGNPFSYVASGFQAPSAAGPDGRTLARHLTGGGRVLLATPQVSREIWETPLYRDVLGLEYRQRWDHSYEFVVAGAPSPEAKKVVVAPARKGEAITTFQAIPGVDGVAPLCVLDDGQWVGATIARRSAETGSEYRAVVLGFHLTDIADDAARRALLARALEFLEGGMATPGIAGAAAPPAPEPAAPPTPQAPSAEGAAAELGYLGGGR
jgi:hypothetical protein